MQSDVACRSIQVEYLDQGGMRAHPRLAGQREGDEVVRYSRELSFSLEVFSACNLCWVKDNVRIEVLGDYWNTQSLWRAAWGIVFPLPQLTALPHSPVVHVVG